MTDQLKRFAREMDTERRQIPDRRNPGWYEELVGELNNHADRIDRRLHGFYVKALIAIAIIGVMCAISLVGFTIVLNDRKETAAEIQDQRRESISRACREQNERNKATKAALVTGAAVDIAQASTPAAKKEVERRRDVTLSLIDALAPYQNCEKAVLTAVSPTRGG